MLRNDTAGTRAIVAWRNNRDQWVKGPAQSKSMFISIDQLPKIIEFDTIIVHKYSSVDFILIFEWWWRPSWKTYRTVFLKNGDRAFILHSVLYSVLYVFIRTFPFSKWPPTYQKMVWNSIILGNWSIEINIALDCTGPLRGEVALGVEIRRGAPWAE